MSRLIKRANNDINMLIKFLDSQKQQIDEKLLSRNNLYEAYKNKLAQDLLKGTSAERLMSSSTTIDKAVQILGKYQLDLFNHYSNIAKNIINDKIKENNLNLSSNDELEINIDTSEQAMRMIQLEVDGNHKLPNEDDMKDYLEEVVSEYLKQYSQVELTTYTIEYVDSAEAKEAINKLKSTMNDVNGFEIKEVRTPQTAKVAKKVLAVNDLFSYLQSQGFDINIVKNGMCAAYYEGDDPSTPNGNVDNIFYYQTSTAEIKTRLKRLAEDQLLLPEQPQYLQLPEGQPEQLKSGYYVITNDLQLQCFDDFGAAEKWLLNNRKDIISREVLNGFAPTNNDWTDYEKKLYENYSSKRYENGPVEDVTYKAIEITLPNDSKTVEKYNDWLNAYKQLFKVY